MKKLVFRTAGILGSLLVLLLFFYAFAYYQTQRRANQVYALAPQTLRIPEDAASYELGRHVADIRDCKDCHGNDFSGQVFGGKDNPLGRLYASNLTPGKGGLQYTDQDWVRALRHGVGQDGKSLWFMPVQHVSTPLSNQELAALISYLQQLPPVDKVHPTKAFKPLGRVLTFLGKFPMFPAELVDHQATYAEEVKPQVSATYGAYLAITCSGCHGTDFKGGPGRQKGEPVIADLTRTGNLKHWSWGEFRQTIRTGQTPEGRQLSDFMPWKAYATSYQEPELEAIYLYLRTLK
ncbi:c-type cytochrome [Adhaeribacter arboris]|uniref:c-type cytochrome n=1 Tax=Adhaeribacter arboris TaxID=2072846 RepID=UPI001304D6B4|nr:c-type cytochrome [Adhaeribacter arboris]